MYLVSLLMPGLTLIHSRGMWISTLPFPEPTFSNSMLFSSRGTLKLVEKSLRVAKLDKSQINEIMLVRGSTCILEFKQLLQDFLNGKELKRPSPVRRQ